MDGKSECCSCYKRAELVVVYEWNTKGRVCFLRGNMLSLQGEDSLS